MATNKRHTVLECEVAVTLKTAAGIKVTGRRHAESSLSKVKIKWEVFFCFVFRLRRRPCESFLATRAPPIKQKISSQTSSAPTKVLLRSPTTPPPVVFGPGQDPAGETLTRPFHARPQKCHLAGVNDYQSNGQVTCSQQEPRSLHLSASHFPCPPFISLQVNYSSRMVRRAHIYSTDKQKNPKPTLSLPI